MPGINTQGIPKEPLKLPHWLLWKAKRRNGKTTKVPYSITGKEAKSNDPSTWGSYQDALSRYKAGGYSGIGFAFSKDDPFCGIDLDHCRDPKTGEFEPWAEKIIKKFQNYTEVSPSGTGVHILVIGKLPEGGRKKGNIEIYDKGRYFTITGNRLDGTPHDIKPAQEAIVWLLSTYFKKEIVAQGGHPCSLPQVTESDSELIQKAINAGNGHKFNLLYQGQWQEVGYSSQSEADQAFCNKLAFWTGKDAGRMDAIFRQSGLMRPKWGKRHYGDGRTYGQVTIEKAISSCRETYTGGRTLQEPITIEDLHRSRALHSKSRKHSHTPTQNDSSPIEKTPFEIAKEQYPRTSFPWDVLPVKIAESLQQLARACATSPTSLPGAAISVFASTIGSTVNVSSKENWQEPLIFWCGDIRPSGSGKTPPPRALMNVLYAAQQMANEVYELELEAWNLLSKKDRGKLPDKPRGYYVTDLTLEGLRTDHSGHGGKVCVLDELSSFCTAQNQYKNKGSDRESWLCLHDGNPARIVRTKESLTLTGCRISVFGGIQPEVWRKIFSENDGLHLVDGTIFRFLPTYEGNSYFPLTKESWSDKNKDTWENLLKGALSWADSQEKPRQLTLSEDAQAAFFEWRNDLFQTKDALPPQTRGFIPKLTGYALRFAGVLYLMHRFSHKQEIGNIIHRDYIEKGTKISEFYLGHVICAMKALAGDVSSPLEYTEQVIHLAKTLENLKSDLDSGRLAVGYIFEKFNGTCRPEQKSQSDKAMGALLRKCNLTILGGKFNANSRRGVKCLQWDKRTNSFIETCPPSPPSPQAKEYQGLQPADIEKLKSAKSPSEDVHGDDLRTLRTLKKQSLQTETGSGTSLADVADVADVFSKEKGKFEDTGAFCSDVDEPEAPR